jgi:periplasmic protein TonB
MFNHLVESGSHTADLRRRGSFFAGTLAFYAMLLVVAGVVSVYAYDAHLDNQNLELVALVSPAPLPVENTHTDTPHAASAPRHNNNISERTAAIARLYSNTNPPDTISVTPNTVPELPRGSFVFSNRNIDADAPSGPTGPTGPPGNYTASNQPHVIVAQGTDEPLPVKPTPRPTPPPVQRLPSNIISSKVLSKPVPVYPSIALQAHVYGIVTVEILIDEQGRVISAQATSGHPLLREAARQAAMQARFTPTQLNGQPVKVSGVITYNFVMQ